MVRCPQWRNRRGGGGGGVQCPPSHWEIPTGKREGRENGEEKKENQKREGGKLKMEGGKVRKMRRGPFFFLSFHF